MTLIKDILGFLDKDLRQQAVLVALSALVFGAIELVGIGSLFIFMQVALKSSIEELPDYYLYIYNFLELDSYYHFLLSIAAITTGTIIVRNTAFVLQQFIQNNFITTTQVKLSTKLFNTYLKQNMEFYFANTTNRLTKNLIQEVPRLVGNTIMSVITIFCDLIILAIILFFLVIKETELIIIACLTISLFYFIIYKFLRNFIREKGKARLAISEVYYNHIRQSLSGIRELKLFNAIDEANFELKKNAEKLKKIFVFFNFYKSLPRQMIEILLVVGVELLVLRQYNSGSTEDMILRLTLIATAIYRLMPKFDSIMHNVINLKFDHHVLQLLKSHLNLSKTEVLTDKKTIPFNSNIVFKKLSYAYPNFSEKPALGPIDMTINKGEVIGLSGESGAGKSTLMEILCQLIHPTKGDIVIDGKVLSHQNEKMNIAYIPQQPSFFEGTIARNILFGDHPKKINLEEMRNAARIAEVDTVIESLPLKYDSPIGENGNLLSGGQRQRIALARAFYKKADLLILDEATNALDKETEKSFIESLIREKGDRTIIIVSHNQQIFSYCDKIIKLRNGKIIPS